MVNYPKGVRNTGSSVSNQIKAGRQSKRGLTFGKRGMGLEEEINAANDFYLADHLAVIYKKPTPVTIVKVDYPARSAAKITEAYFQRPSTTDYNGVYQGRYLDFDAKETKNKTSFPMKNVHEHQVRHLANIVSQGGVGFLLIKFTTLDETYLYPAPELVAAWQRLEGHKSLSYSELKDDAYLVEKRLTPSLDYLKAVDAYLTDLASGKRTDRPKKSKKTGGPS
ncbi:Holliday junction resolvase RecU [Fructobacillus sp. M1-13]|uniref:Holliday junction resolvase RecU n=1 Tax=Fructobacillus papyriferae TaxID=2713171 RepID=A0ABS5QNV6_9LACO|nr:Holliday junction resolvase RecU [Fructobacillus papyriferae]MBS9334818.1 Holliday junction resolvase RecU [Fructobacillus papyriferae]MCD2158808.1 Holliday junction resolvase RecU [Fructobacillus papyriferae]